MRERAVVVGAGPGGLACAALLQGDGMLVEVVERGEGVGANWRSRYDGLRLNTVRWLSHLPGYRMRRSVGRWVGRDDYVDYLEQYRAHHRIEVTTNAEMLDLRRGYGGWTIRTTKGELQAPVVVVASGAFDRPTVPPWPGLDRYRGDFRHVARYRNADQYHDRHVLVVGGGASGLEIAAQLADAGARRVDLSVRTGVHLFPRQLGRFPTTPYPVSRFLPGRALDTAGELLRQALPGDWPKPLPRPPMGLGAGLAQGIEPVVADDVVAALRAGRIHLVAAVSAFASNEVRLADGTAIAPDAVIAATGYRSRLDETVGELGVLDRTGNPARGDGGADPRFSGLIFVGFQSALTGRLPQFPNQARRALSTARFAILP
jgi:putative flavoprotein involved in K+ transport